MYKSCLAAHTITVHLFFVDERKGGGQWPRCVQAVKLPFVKLAEHETANNFCGFKHIASRE